MMPTLVSLDVESRVGESERESGGVIAAGAMVVVVVGRNEMYWWWIRSRDLVF